MSIYVTRLIEVKLPDIKGSVYTDKDLELIEDVSYGDVYKVCSDYNTPYRVYHPEEDTETGTISSYWVKTKDCNYSWHLVKYWGNNKYGYSEDDEEYIQKIFGSNIKLRKIVEFSDNGGSIRDKYLSKWSGEDYNYYDRGVPDDISDECKKELHIGEPNYCWGHTHVLLSEWEDLYNKELEKFKSKIKDTIFKSELKTIDEKLDKIINKVSNIPDENTEDTNKVNNDDEYEYEETLDTIFEEYFWDIQTLHNEIIKVYHIVHQLYGYVTEENIRINYYFS